MLVFRTGMCERCGSELLKENMARQKKVRGRNREEERDVKKYCRKNLTEDYIKKHEKYVRRSKKKE